MRNITTSGALKTAALTVLTVFCLTACEDPRRVSWSPDGSLAAVIGGDGLRISDSEGKLGDAKPGVELVNWFADNRHLLTVEYEKLNTWDAVRKVENPDDLRVVMDTAAKILLQSKNYKGKTDKASIDKFGESVKDLPFTTEAVFYLRENKDKEMTANLGDWWTSVKGTVDVGVHKVHSYDVGNKTFSEDKMFYQTMRDLKEVRLSPNGRAALLVTRPERSDDSGYNLTHLSFPASLDGAMATDAIVSGAAAIHPDWTADGSGFYYVEADLPVKAAGAPDSGNLPLIGSLRLQNTDCQTAAIKSAEKPKTLARMIFRKNCKVRALADGRVVFSAMPIQLPCGDSQLNSKQTLFVVKPKENVLVAPMMPIDAVDFDSNLIEFFETNPSGKLISIPSTTDGVFVYDVLSGNASRVNCGEFGWASRFAFVPTWRNDDELCLSLKSGKAEGKAEKDELMLWSHSKDSARSLSSSWPESVRKGFLERREVTPNSGQK